MQDDALQARSFAAVEATILGYAVVLGVVAFARYIGLIVNDEWLVPLLLAMGIQFAAECLLSAKLGSFSWATVSAVLTIKCLLVLSVAMAFTVQRMQIDDPAGVPWGHFTIAGAILYELYRFARVLRAFDVYLGPFDAMVAWFERQFGGPVREATIRREKVQAAVCERKAARAEYWDSGEVKSAPAIDVKTGELPETDCDSDVVPVTPNPFAGPAEGETGAGGLDSGRMLPPPPAP